MANRFTRALIDLLPRTGRMIKEDGAAFNEADFHALKQREEVSSQSLLGNAYAASTTVEVVNGGTVDYVLEIPAGIKVDFHSRIQSVVGGKIKLSVLNNPDEGYAIDESVKAWNLDEEIGNQSQSTIVRASAPTTGATFRRESILYPPGTGSNEASSTTNVADAIPQYVSTTLPVLRLENTGNSTATVNINYIWVERDVIA